MLSAFFMNAAIYGLTGWQASYLVDTFKLTLGQISGLTAAVGVVMMITALGSGVFVKRFFTGREKIFIVVTGVLGALCVFTTSMTDSLALAGLFLALSVGCASCAFSTLMSMPVKLFVPAEVSTKYSIINTAGVAGGFVAPIIIGKLVDSGQGSYTNAFIFIAVTLGLSGLIAAVVTAKKKIEVDYV